jgi:DNA-directed RNA polymerase specialized sigma24 family protein
MAITTDESTLLSRFEIVEADPNYRRMIRTFARSCLVQLPGFAMEDIQQELLMVLWRCVNNYDPDRGAAFRTLFMGSAQRHVIGLVRTANAQKRGKGVITYLDDEAFASAAERSRTEGSAEDWYLALAEHGDKFVDELELSA